jgi:hypothetical protein
MFWLSKNKRIWRIIVLILMMAALTGPWAYDRINVPAEYACSAPFIRLEGDFCGTPLSGIWFFSAISGELIGAVVGLFTGIMVIPDLARMLLVGLLGFFLVLPFISTILLVLREERLVQFIFQVVVCSLVICLGALWIIFNPVKLGWSLWGIWLYVGLVAGALILEVILLMTRRRISYAVGHIS